MPPDECARVAPRQHLVLDSETAHRNVTLRPQGFLAARPPRVLDFVETAAAAYLADLVVRRGEAGPWVRDFAIEVAVTDVQFWRDARPSLEALLHLLTGDNVTVRFVPRSAPPPSASPLTAPPGVDCVSLLSGGADSLAG
ncbi:MAG: hypothetical protein ACE5O2_14765, partial [Armatimonadota bacterium]